MMVLFNGTREETLNWLHAHNDKIDTLYVGMYDRPVIVSAWEYINMYA